MSKKKYKLRLQREAFDDLDYIYRYISQDSLRNAKRFIKGLQKKIRSLKSFPKRGSLCRIVISDIFEELRFISYKGYLIFYDVKKDGVIILHISGPGQDWMNLFL